MTPRNATNITTATTTVVKSGAGIFDRIVINTTAAGTKIGTIAASAGVGSYQYNCKFDTGLTIVTGAASDLTVTWE